jgi:hypothetical protein
VSTRQNEKPRTALEIPARVESHSSLLSACLSSLLTRELYAPRTMRRQRVYDPFLRPPSALPLPSFPHPYPVLPPLPILRANPRRTRARRALAMHAMEEPAVRNMTSPPYCKRRRTTGITPSAATHVRARASRPRRPMAQSVSRITPRTAASRAPATHTMALARGRDI